MGHPRPGRASRAGGPRRAIVSLGLISALVAAGFLFAGCSDAAVPSTPVSAGSAQPGGGGSPPSFAAPDQPSIADMAAAAEASAAGAARASAPTPPTGQTAPAQRPTPAQVLAALQASGVRLVPVEGWDEEWDLPSRQADWHPVGVMLHHTGTAAAGDAPTLQFLTDYESTMTLSEYDGLAGGKRGAALLVGREGTVYLLRATRGPHAGIGGPMAVGSDTIPEDDANGYFFGIEIESAGNSQAIHDSSGPADGFSAAQVEATARASAALLALVGRGSDHLVDHKAWAGEKQGKPDLVGDAVEAFRIRVAQIMSGGS